jgi:RHS repeat-associated protein
MKVLGYASLLVVALAGPDIAVGVDWVQKRGDPGFTAYSPLSVPDKLHIMWSVNKLAGAPVVVGATIFQTSTMDSMLFARRVSDGGTLWEVSVADGITTSQPAVGEGKVFIAAEYPAGAYQAFDTNTGQRQWVTEAGENDDAHSYLGNELFYCALNTYGAVVCFADKLYSYPLGSYYLQAYFHRASDGYWWGWDVVDWEAWWLPEKSSLYNYRLVVTENDLWYTLGIWKPSWCDVRITAKREWVDDTNLGWEDAKAGGPVLAKDGLLIYLSPDKQKLSAIVAKASSYNCPADPPRWTSESLGDLDKNRIAAGEGRIVALSNSKVSLLDLNTGVLLNQEVVDGIPSTGPTIAHGFVLYGDSGGVVHVLDWDTLKQKQEVQVSGAAIIGDVIVLDEGVLVAAEDGTLALLVGALEDVCDVRSSGYAQNGSQTVGLGGVNTLSRNMVFTIQDLSIPFAGLSINLLRSYNSEQAAPSDVVSSAGTVGGQMGLTVKGTMPESALGRGWTHSYQVALKPLFDSATGVTLYAEGRGDGRVFGYTYTISGDINNPPGIVDDFKFEASSLALSGTTAGTGVSLRKKQGLNRRFDPDGNLLAIEDPNGNNLLFTYTTAGSFTPGVPGVRLLSIMYVSSTPVTGPASATVFLGYDSSARLKEVEYPNPSGTGTLKMTFQYTMGLLSSVEGPPDGDAQYKAQYEYELATGRMQHKIDPRAPPGEKKLRYTYDTKGHVLTVNTESNLMIAQYGSGGTPDGKQHVWIKQVGASGLIETDYVYSRCGMLEEVWDSQGGRSRYVWDGSLNQIQLTDALGRSTSWFHDSKGNVTKAIDAKGNLVSYEYEPKFNQITRKVDAEGNEILYDYDDSCNLIRTTQKLKAFEGDSSTDFLTLHAYDSRGLRISTTEANGSFTGYEYDGRGNLTAVVQVLKLPGNTSTRYITRYEYDALGRRTVVMDPKGIRTEYDYDRENRLIQLRAGIAGTATAMSVITCKYDNLNRLTKETDAAGRFTAYEYDERDQLVSVTNNLGFTTTHEYDGVGNRIKTTDPNGNETRFEYDRLNRLKKVIDAEGGTAQYGYDAVGNLKQVKDPNGHMTSYDYDKLNRLTRVTHPDMTTEEFAYDKIGNRLTRRDSRPVTVSYSYDSLYRLRKVDFSDTTPDAVFKYDQVGNRIYAETQVDGQSYVTDYQYDSLDRMTGETIRVGGTGLVNRSFAYDPAGNRLSQEVDATAVPDIEHRIAYDYDSLNRVKMVTSRGQTAGYEYDLSGNLVRISYPNRVETRRTYDMAGRLTELRNVRLPSQVALDYFKYGYDKMNNRILMREITGLNQYGYDKLYRLVSVDYPRYPDQSYGYDPAGNRLTLASAGKDTQHYSYGSMNQLLSVQEGDMNTGYEWDVAGNLNKKTQNAVDKTEYYFDGANRLIGASISSGQSLTYGYDCNGHRVYRKEGTGITWFVFDGLSVVMELNKDRKASAAIVPGVSKINLSYHIPVTEFFLYDGLGSVVMRTDILGNPTQIYHYDVFGGIQNLNSDPFNRYRYIGLAHEDALGLVYMNARWYDPVAGRFIGRDSIVNLMDGTQAMNEYVYALNNPLNLTDIGGRTVWRDKIKEYAEKAKDYAIEAWERAKDAEAYIEGEIKRRWGNNEEQSAESEAAERERICQKARELEGKPYEFGKKGPDSYDCSGAAGECHEDIKGMNARNQRRQKMRSAKYVPSRSDLKPGDTIYWRPKGKPNKNWHTGIVQENEDGATTGTYASPGKDGKTGRVREQTFHYDDQGDFEFAGGGRP